MTAPLTPAACDLRGLQFMPLDCARLLDSDLFALTTGDEFKAALALWCKSWTQVPAASMPSDERLLAKAAGLNLADWRAVAEMALKGWVECDDGRLYHPVVAEKALVAWLDRLAHKDKSAKGSAARYETFKYDPEAFARDRLDALRCLSVVAPDLAREKGFLPQAEPAPAPSSQAPAPSSQAPAPSNAPSSEKRCEGRGRGNIPVGAETPDQRAWREAVELLTGRGGMLEKSARAFFAKLLRDHKLEPHKMLPSVVRAELMGTPEPKSYLVAAAKALQGDGAAAKPAADVSSWGDDVWRIAVSRWSESGAWAADVMGPEPFAVGCWVPVGVLNEWAGKRRPGGKGAEG